MTLQVVEAAEWSAGNLAACFSESFDGYLAGSFVMDAAALTHFLARQGAELALSRAVVRDGALAGIAFVGPCAGRRRIGGMGVRREARGSGASRLLLQRVIDDAKQAGVPAVELEVFVQNTPAVRLYRAMGFAEGAPLWGFERAPVEVEPAAPPREVTIEDAADWLDAQRRDDLPYQVSAAALRGFDPAASKAWRLGSALMVWREAAPQVVTVQILFDADPRQRDALALLQALPRCTVRVPQLMRDDVAGWALREAGFATLPLHQMQMHLPL